MKRICAVIATLILFMGCSAIAEDLQYELESGEATITGYTGANTELILPDSIDGVPVTAIADSALKGNKEIISVIIPNSITRIGAGAFIGCDALISVTIANNDCEIGMFAFEACSDDLVISAETGSTAEEYAATNSMTFSSIGTDERAQEYLDAQSALEAGELETALKKFGSLGAYKDSQKYFMYISALLYDENGNSAYADSIYLLLGDFLDSAERTAADTYIGGKKVTLPSATQAPTASELMAYQDYSEKFPYEFEDSSKTANYYALYFNIDSADEVDAYIAIFTDAGWTIDIQDEGDWQYKYIISPDGNTYFYTGTNTNTNTAVFVYSSDSDYGFDPINGLY